jgi:hypothetical protein
VTFVATSQGYIGQFENIIRLEVLNRLLNYWLYRSRYPVFIGAVALKALNNMS